MPALNLAADALQSQWLGSTAGIYAQALRQAGQALQGQNGISADTVVPFMQGLLNGTRSATNASPGQGTLVDSLAPGGEGYLNARQQGMNNQQAIIHGLGSALMGSRSGQNQSSLDPGAASGTSVLGGIFKQLSYL